jgi:hypothetical protein
MASLKAIKGVAYDIAHHAQSGLSYVHPYIGELCAEIGINETSLSLLDSHPYPENLRRIEPLELACTALKRKFIELLEKMDLPIAEVTSIDLRFIFGPTRADHYLCSVESILIRASGTKYVQLVK